MPCCPALRISQSRSNADSDIAISTAPDAPPTHWQQIYLPLLQPLTLAAGDALEVTLTSDTRPDVGLRVQWQVRQWRGDQRIAAQQLDSFKGRL